MVTIIIDNNESNNNNDIIEQLYLSNSNLLRNDNFLEQSVYLKMLKQKLKC